MMDIHNKELEEARKLLYEARKLLFEQLHASDKNSRGGVAEGLSNLSQAFELAGNSHIPVVMKSGKTLQPRTRQKIKTQARTEEALSLMTRAREIFKNSEKEDLQTTAEFLRHSICCLKKS